MFTGSPPDILEYDCYRRYLGDWFQAEKSRNPRFSHRVFAARAGFTSSALLPLILQGRRNLTPRYFDGFVRALRLPPREAAVFHALVALGNARDDDARRRCEESLRAARQGGARRVGPALSDLFDSWRHVAVHQALECVSVADDLAPLREALRPSPTLAQLRASLALLRRLGLVERDGQGRWKGTNANLLGDSRTGPWAVRGFQEQMLDLGKTAHERFPSGRLVSRTETLAVGEAAAERIRERLRACFEEIAAIAVSDSDVPATVLQVNAQLFPLTETRPA